MAVINMLDNGESMQSIAKRFDIGRSTVYDIKERRNKIKAHADNFDKRKTLKFGKFPEVDLAIYNWFLEERAKNNLITGDLMREKAKEIYLSITGQEFKASSGWLDKFKKRFRIRFNVSGEKTFQSHDDNQIANFIKTFNEKVDLLGLTVDQLYCADASALPLKILSKFIKTEYKQTYDADKITFMPCSNATGTHKIDLLVIGTKSADEINISSLPICYKTQTNCWLTREIFTEWFHEEFVPAVRQFMITNHLPEKALLILDEAPGYPEEYYLKSNDWMIQAMFLPPEYSHIIQPIDKFVMQEIKTQCRKNILSDAVSKTTNIIQNLRDFNLNQFMPALVYAWSNISWNSIRRSWTKLLPSLPYEDDNVDGPIPDDLQVMKAIRGCGINDTDVNDWIAGKADEIKDVILSEELTIEVMNVEDPLTLQKLSEDLKSDETFSVKIEKDL